MTLVVLGLLLGMVGLVWVMVISLMRADHQPQRYGSREPDKPVAGSARRESKAA
jgi:hypothetical protein